MRSLVGNRRKVESPNLRSWLRHGDPAMAKLKAGATLDKTLQPHNQLSQLNVLLQMEHVKSYPVVQQRLKEGNLGIHGWWFDIAKADVYAYEPRRNKFVLIDEEEAERLMQRLGN